MSFRFFAEAPVYEFQEVLGESVVSEVYLAFRRSKGFKIPVVIKLFRQQGVADLQMESLLRARSGANLIKVISFEKFNSRSALIMEYIEGVSLKTLLGKKSFSQDEKACICAQTLKGLKALKTAGLSHGDLSPSNIIINRKGHLYLTDYGLANYAKEIYGTEPFLAPELYRGHPANFASDLFSLGVLERVLQGADLLSLKSEHFICEEDPLLDPHAIKRKVKDFSFSPQAFFDLGERVSEALLLKKCLPVPSSLLKHSPPLLSHINIKTWFKAGEHKTPQTYFWLSACLVFLVFLVNPFVSYGQYKPDKKQVAILQVRSQRWLYVQMAGVSGYTPLTISVREPGLYKLKWKNKKGQGAKYVYLTAGQKTMLKDKDFY